MNRRGSLIIICLFLCFLIIGCSSISPDKNETGEVAKTSIEDSNKTDNGTKITNEEDEILGRYTCNERWIEIYKYNGQILVGMPFMGTPDKASAALYDNKTLMIPDGKIQYIFMEDSFKIQDETDQFIKDDNGNILIFHKEFAIKPSIEEDETILDKYAGKWCYRQENKWGVLTIIPKDKNWTLRDNRQDIYPLEYKNGSFYSEEYYKTNRECNKNRVNGII